MALFLSGNIGDQFHVWPLDRARIGIGRSSRNDIQIGDGTVSKEHAEVVRRGDRCFLRDLGSRNGTRVNGEDAKEPIELRAGDLVGIGHVTLRVTDAEPARKPRLSDATVLGSSLRIHVDQILDRRSRSGETSAKLVHLLADAGKLLVLPRPLKETCEEILLFVEKAIPASRHILLLQQDGAGEPVQVAARFGGGRADQPLALSRSIMRRVLDECTSVLTADAASDPRFQGQQSIVMQSVHSAMAVPLFDNEKVLGLIYVDSHDLRITFGEAELELLTLLANMAAVKISNARLLEAEEAQARIAQELATATGIQRGLLPVEPPRLPGYELDAFLESCYEVGGDLYDFYVRGDGSLLVLVGDVTGKGMGAALLMSSFLASARVLYDAIEDLAELAKRLNAIIYRSTDPMHFVTAFVGRLDPATGVLTYVNAGHPPPCLVLGGTLRELDTTGVPFGMLESFPYTAETIGLAPGATLAVFSDGIPEARKGEEFFEDERTREVMVEAAPAPRLEDVRDRVLRRVRDFVGDAPRSDDMTLLLVRRIGTPGP
jgi:serine phosphatase RsbU (regulator of sigma subunit)